ncbi:MAG: hypothetical protein WCY09_01670 [Candidatus Omnitrophota bacterium]
MKKKWLFLSLIFSVFLFFDWFVSDQIRALKIDRNILYSIDDIFRFCYIKASFFYPEIFLNPNLKILSTLISRIFYQIFPLGMLSLRIMSSLFSVAAIYFLYKTTKRINPEKKLTILPVLFTLTSGVYFLISISTLAESMFIFCLVLAAYLFYSKRYLFSTVIMAFLPTIRQEGVIFLIVWVILLLQQNKSKYLLILFVPLFTWSLANCLILKHSFSYTLFYFTHLTSQTPPGTLILPSEISLGIVLSLLPAAILFGLGLIRELSNRKYLLIFLCIFFHLGFLILADLIKLFKTGYLPYVIRLFAPSIPFVSIYMSSGLEFIMHKFIQKKRGMVICLSLVVLIATSLMIFRLKEFQKFSNVKNDSVSKKEILALDQAGLWLDDYMQRNHIAYLYALGGVATDRFIRRTWMGVSGKIRFYALVDSKILLDMFSFKRIPIINDKAIFISLSGNDSQYLSSFKKEFLKGFPELPLEFFILEPVK